MRHSAPILALYCFALVACTVDPESVPAGNNGGLVVPTGGSSGSGGSGATSGSAGSAGSGASSGTAGTGAGGTGGSAGTGATSGTGGGGSGGSAGTAGTAGTAGSGGVGGGLVLTGTPEDETQVKARLITECATNYNAADQAMFYGPATPPANWDSSMRGTIERCAFDRVITKAEITQHYADTQAELAVDNPELGTLYPDPMPQTDIFKFRVVYWTEREANEPVLTSAALYLPALRITDGDDKIPGLIFGHGTVGAADKCAPSLEDPEGFHTDWKTQVFSLSGQGWTGLMPDYIGLGTPLIYAWQSSRDESHALLDGTRAIRNLFTNANTFSSHNVIVGHSQGGHAVFSAQAAASSYGSAGTIDAVLAWAPLFFSQGGWGALLTSLGGSFASGSSVSSAAMYFYGHEAYLTDEASRFSMFDAGRVAEVTTWLEDRCWIEMTGQEDTNGDNKDDHMTAIDVDLNAAGVATLFADNYSAEVGPCGFPGPCTTTLAQKWNAQWILDRPDPDPAIPIVYWVGNNDASIVPGRAKCAIDRLCGSTDPANSCSNADLTVCVDPVANHAGVVSTSTPWVRLYLEHKLLGSAAPPACSGVAALSDQACDTPPLNGLDPATTP